MSQQSTVGLSRRQKVFVSLESVLGTLVFPNATTDFIRPAGNAVMNQKPEFVNSEELADTLDVLDQFQNATPAGDWTIRMYVRPSGTIATANPPQGHALFKSLQGSIGGNPTAELTNNMTDVQDTAVVDTIAGGTLPHVGVITIGSEKIRYTGMIQTIATQATLTGCTRGYNGTTAATHATNAAVTLISLFYKQAVTSPSLSIWIGTDHFVQAMAGCSVNQATLEVTNEGGCIMTFTGQGCTMKWAGTSSLASGGASAATFINVGSEAKLYSAGMYLYNYTKTSTRNLIIASNATSGRIRLTDALGATWATGDVIKGYLPTGTAIGTAIEARDSAAYVSGTLTKIKRGTLTIGTPKQYLTDEIGTTYPEDYLENVRAIASTLNLYFRKADAKYFKDGYAGNDVPVRLSFGDTAGYMMNIYMKRVKLTVPEINFAPPAIELNMGMTALGTAGEDSLEIVFT